MKRLALSLSLLLLPTQSFAGGPSVNIYEGFATEVTQYLNQFQLLAQTAELLSQGVELVQQGNRIRDQLTDMLHQAENLENFRWYGFFQKIDQLQGVIETGQALAYTAAATDSRFKELFPGYDDYIQKTQEFSPVYFREKYRAWHITLNDSFESTFKMHKLTYKQMISDTDRIKALKNRLSSSEGRNQLLRAGADISLFTSQQLRRLNTIMMQQSQVQSTYLATKENKEAVQEARKRQFYDKSSDGLIVGDEKDYLSDFLVPVPTMPGPIK